MNDRPQFLGNMRPEVARTSHPRTGGCPYGISPQNQTVSHAFCRPRSHRAIDEAFGDAAPERIGVSGP